MPVTSRPLADLASSQGYKRADTEIYVISKNYSACGSRPTSAGGMKNEEEWKPKMSESPVKPDGVPWSPAGGATPPPN